MGSVECSWSQRTMLARSYVWPVWKTITGSRITSCQLITSESFDPTAENLLRSRPEQGDLRARMRIRVCSAQRSRGGQTAPRFQLCLALPGRAAIAGAGNSRQPLAGLRCGCRSAPEDGSNTMNTCPLHRQCPTKMKVSLDG